MTTQPEPKDEPKEPEGLDKLADFTRKIFKVRKDEVDRKPKSDD